MTDPCLSRQEIEATDPVRTALATLFSAWYAVFGSTAIKIKLLVEKSQGQSSESIALREAVLDLAGLPNGEINERSLANQLKRYKNRIEHGYRLEIPKQQQGTSLWRIKKIV